MSCGELISRREFCGRRLGLSSAPLPPETEARSKYGRPDALAGRDPNMGRVASAVLRLSWTDVQARLNYQEFRGDDPFSCFLGTLVFLSTQVHVFHVLTLAFPEVIDPIWASRVHLFNNEVARLWKRLEARFARECRELEEQRQGAAVPLKTRIPSGRGGRDSRSKPRPRPTRGASGVMAHP
jgi:hypothetical protein